MPVLQTHLAALAGVVQPAGPLGPVPFLHLRARALADAVLDEVAARDGEAAREDAREVVRRGREVGLVVPEEEGRERYACPLLLLLFLVRL